MLRSEKRNPRNWRYAITALMALVAITIISVGIAQAGTTTNTQAQGLNKQERLSTAAAAGPVLVHELKHDVSPPLRDIVPAPAQPKNTEREIKRRALNNPGNEYSDPVVQFVMGPLAMPTPILTFAGINSAGSACACLPPDTNGDVGPNHYVQTVNSAYQVWNKAGTPLSAPLQINTLWAGFGGACQTRNDGDPIVKYDQIADRWVINQFTSAAPYTQCIAVSTSPDPMGSFNRYAFPQFQSATRFGDYQKIGVWPDGYYMSNNEFIGNSFVGAGNYAFDRVRMLAGLAATYVYFGLPASDWGGQQPTDFDGSTLPPVGAPNLFVEIDDSAWDPPNIPTDQIQMWRFHVDYVTPANSTFTALTPFTPGTLANFDGILCNFSPCVPQSGTATKLDSITDRVMYRAAYRNFGGYESVTFNHTVDAGTDKAAIRWYEIRGINTTPTLFQQSTYDPDTNHHWMGSIAQDRQGNMALGYSASSSTTFPSIRYSGRLVSDPLNTLPQGEAVLVSGTGSQTHSSGRWGDYSSMNVDPVDDCTFWYTQEYYTATSSANWQTRIGSFKFPGCTAGAPTATPTRTATSTNTPSNTPTNVPTSTSTRTSTSTNTPSNTPTSTSTRTPTSTNTPTNVPTSTPTNTSTNTRTNTPTNTPTIPSPTSTATGTYSPTITPSWTPTSTSTHTSTNTPTSTNTAIPTNTPTNTPTSTPSNTPTNLPTNTPTNTPTGTQPPTNTPTRTPTNTPTNTLTNTPTNTPTGTQPPTNTPTRTPTQVSTSTNTPAVTSTTSTPTTPVSTPTICTIEFTDVPVGSTFYPYIHCMACMGIINGYNTDCATGNPCFRPSNNVTRGQLAKIVSNSAGFNDTPGAQQFQDVAPGSTFYDFVWRLADRTIVSGYTCGGPGEPCVGPGNLPYYRPNTNVSRGQISKIVSEAAGFNDTPGAQQFQDVAPGSTFYNWIWRLTDRTIMNGYACGGVGEPCVGPGNLPYFRPGANATRGQASKIVSNTFFPGCGTR